MAVRWRVLSTSGGAGIHRSSDLVWIAAQVRGICMQGERAQVDTGRQAAGWKIIFEVQEGVFKAEARPANKQSLLVKEEILELLQLYGSL